MAAREACEPSALNATSGLIELGARENDALDAAIALVEPRHIARAAATPASFIEERAIYIFS